jgi:hypothetical protein
MDQQPPVPPQNTSLFQLNLDAANSYTLRSAASWAKVLAIVGLICGILFFIFGILVQATVRNYGGNRYYNDDLRYNTSTIANLGMAVYIIMGLIFIISSIFALNFANKITRALRANDQYSLSSGFAGARNYFAFWAILMILFLLLMLIGVVGNMGR